MLANALQFIGDGFFSIIGILLSLLPTLNIASYASAFEGSIFSTVIGWVNWFIPVGEMLAVLTAWSVAILAYNAYLAMRNNISLVSG